MKILYFDCFAGISGDMTLGALLDLGIDKDKFLEELSKVNVGGFKVEFARTDKNGISAFDVDVIIEEHCGHHNHGEKEQHNHEDHEHSHGEHHSHEDHEHSHGEHHSHEDHEHSHGEHHSHEGREHSHGEHHSHEGHEHGHGEGKKCGKGQGHGKGGGCKHGKGHKHGEHHHRNLFDVTKIIDESQISENAKALAKNIFMRVANAEAKVHGKALEDVHFHEVGALDSIVDIIGTAICIDMLKVDKIYSSVVNDGYGFTMCQHGQIPVPVPATAEIFANSGVVSRQIDVEMELVTPTGAAIIAELPLSYGIAPTMKVLKTGYGAGKRSSKIPNVLRVTLGEGFED